MRYPLCAAAIVLPLGMMAITPSWAADTCTGLDTLVTQASDVTDLGQGLKKMVWTAQSVVTSSDLIYALVVGECSSTTLTTPDGKSQAQGYCARHDKDGDTQSVAINQPPGADKITWKSTGGIGKYAGKQDAGWAQPIFAEGSVLVVKWGGDCH